MFPVPRRFSKIVDLLLKVRILLAIGSTFHLRELLRLWGADVIDLIPPILFAFLVLATALDTIGKR